MAPFRSPITGNIWADARPAIGTIVGLTHYMLNLPHRRLDPALQQAIDLATNAAQAFAGVPKLTSNGFEGVPLALAYDLASTASKKLTPFLTGSDGDAPFATAIDLRNWHYTVQHAQEHAASGCNGTGWKLPGRADPEPCVSCTRGQRILDPAWDVRVARLAYWAAVATVKAVTGLTPAGLGTLDQYDPAAIAAVSAAAELERAGISKQALAHTETLWRFVVCAGRLPVMPDDEDLLLAFDAALSVGADDFARQLVHWP